MSTIPLPPRKVHLWHIFLALLVMNGPLPAKLKFRENTEAATFEVPASGLSMEFGRSVKVHYKTTT